MIRTFIISLASETARRAHMETLCREHGIDAVFVDAVDMRGAAAEELEKLSAIPVYKKPRKRRSLSAGEVGCALSHHHVYREMAEQGLDYALVLEDDAKFLRNPGLMLDEKRLQSLMVQSPFDVLILGYVKTLEEQLPYHYRRLPIKKKAVLQLPDGKAEFGTLWDEYSCGTVAYVITLEGARKLLDMTARPCVTADDWKYFVRHCGLRILHSRPVFVLEDVLRFDSSIRNDSLDSLKPKFSSAVIRSLKGYWRYFAMNYLGFR
ncbi:glycosyltransferase family 25 protein [Neisseria weaveri]|uniref:LgtE n=1 Tax=Neisseria weaveri TaxID=28091 RepID=A0A448VK91_9NEIS|nr:glycosyltransferase family 25 protein [Neisseria weaveri]EGV35825.1 hypothetical protein l13_11630 [Neisseria weaveri ATCC 51223]VEJ50175.1 LgtE [Neisseria weaveri]